MQKKKRNKTKENKTKQQQQQQQKKKTKKKAKHLGDLVLQLQLTYSILYNNKINARVLIGQSAMVYCAGKPMEKSRVL